MTASAHHFHAAVWLDHREAKVFEFGLEGVTSKMIHAHDQHTQIHTQASPPGSGKHHGEAGFYKEIAAALSHAGEVVVMGPGTAKNEFKHYLEDHAPQLAKKVLAYEAADHPNDAKIVEHARAAFKRLDRMLPQHR